MYWAIGMPGEMARLIVPGSAEAADRQLRDGEVYALIERPGLWRLLPDGTAEAVADRVAEMAAVRARRHALLTDSDVALQPDRWAEPLTDAQRAEWIAYRQALRDLPADQPDATIDTIIWPEPPHHA